MAETIQDVLEDEICLLNALIGVVDNFEPQTQESEKLCYGVKTDLNDWKATNNALIEKSDAERVTALEKERDQIQALIDVTETNSVFEFESPDHSSSWWKDYLNSEKASAVRLRDLISP